MLLLFRSWIRKCVKTEPVPQKAFIIILMNLWGEHFNYLLPKEYSGVSFHVRCVKAIQIITASLSGRLRYE
jgi:hypothetical protein